MFRKIYKAVVSRPLKNYNVISRAEKAIDKEKTVIAPKFKSSEDDHLSEEG